MAKSFIRIETQNTEPLYPLNRPVVIVTPVNATAELGVDIDGNTTVNFLDPSAGLILPSNQPQDFFIEVSDDPAERASDYLARFILPRVTVFAAGLVDSRAQVNPPYESDTTCQILRNADQIGLIFFPADAAAGSFIMGVQAIFNPGDVLSIGLPDPATNAARLSITLVGSRSFM